MSYRHFDSMDKVKQLGITIDTIDSLFQEVRTIPNLSSLHQELADNEILVNSSDNEKARSEWIVSPVMTYLWKRYRHSFGLFSGVKLNVDQEKGLTGNLDFVCSSKQTEELEKPILLVVEAKDTNIKFGQWQCAAELYAATVWSDETNTLYGLATTGDRWRFMSLHDSVLRVEKHILSLDKLPVVCGKITQCLQLDLANSP